MDAVCVQLKDGILALEDEDDASLGLAGLGEVPEEEFRLMKFDDHGGIDYDRSAGWSSLVARWAHNPKVGGSNPPPATIYGFGGLPA